MTIRLEENSDTIIISNLEVDEFSLFEELKKFFIAELKRLSKLSIKYIEIYDLIQIDKNAFLNEFQKFTGSKTITFDKTCNIKTNLILNTKKSDRFSIPELRFDGSNIGAIDFSSCYVQKFGLINKAKLHKFIFEGDVFRQMDILDSEVYELDLKLIATTNYSSTITIQNSLLGKKVGSNKLSFMNQNEITQQVTFIAKKVTFNAILDATHLPPQSNFIDCKFNDLSFDSIQKYRQLKAIFKGHNDDKLADEFERLELRSSHESIGFLKDPVNKTIGWFYTLYNSFGGSLWQPIAWYFILLFLFTCIYASNNVFIPNLPENQSLAEWIISGYHNVTLKDSRYLFDVSFVHSLVNSLGPIGFIYHDFGFDYKNGWWASLAIFQKTLFTIMWFLFIMQVRRRFKLS